MRARGRGGATNRAAALRLGGGNEAERAQQPLRLGRAPASSASVASDSMKPASAARAMSPIRSSAAIGAARPPMARRPL